MSMYVETNGYQDIELADWNDYYDQDAEAVTEQQMCEHPEWFKSAAELELAMTEDEDLLF